MKNSGVKLNKKLIAFEILLLLAVITICSLIYFVGGHVTDIKNQQSIEQYQERIEQGNSLNNNNFKIRYNFLEYKKSYINERYSYDAYKKKILNDKDTTFRRILYREMCYYDSKYGNDISFEDFLNSFEYDSIDDIDEQISALEGKPVTSSDIRSDYERIYITLIIVILLIAYPLRFLFYLVRWSINTIKESDNFKNTNSNTIKKYFYSNGNDKEGPITLEELKQKDINPKSLIWHEGLDDWKEAETIEELKEIFELIPPPIDPENNTPDTDASMDLNSESHSLSKSIYATKKQRMFSNPFSFDGRIRRTEYGLSFLIVVLALSFVNELVKDGYSLVALVDIPLYWILWAQGAKRCHDLGKNGWWQIVPFYLLLLTFSKGEIGINKYGTNPKNL